jgi:hypothetical protein
MHEIEARAIHYKSALTSLVRTTDEYLKSRAPVTRPSKSLSFAKREYTQLELVKGR